MAELPPPRGPLARLMGMLVLLAAFVVSLFLGTVLFLTVLGAILILGLALYLRIWWLKRRWAGQTPPSQPPDAKRGVTLEGEYTRKDQDRR